MIGFLFFAGLSVMCGWLALEAHRNGREGVALFCAFAAVLCVLVAGTEAQLSAEQEARERAAATVEYVPNE